MNQKLIQKYISGDATQEEKEEIARWLQADEKNRKQLLSYRKMYDLTIWQEELTPLAECETAFGFGSKAKRIGFELVKIAAIFLIALLTYRYFLPPSGEEQKKTVMQSLFVPAGQRAEICLADGTKVWLNAMTTLTFPNNFTGNQRKITLNGEGYFDVAKDPERPFIVETDKYDITATGTEFNVIAYKGTSTFETALLEGSVEVSSANTGQHIQMTPHTYLFSDNGKLVKAAIEHTNYFLWREGLICFYDEPVGKMIDKLQLYYDIRIDVQNKQLLDNRYTGKFRSKDGVEHVLRVLRLSNKFTYKKDDDLNLITIK